MNRPRGGRRAGSAGAGDLSGKLLDAAASLIAERGPQGFSLREVARRARVSEAAPYWHFPNKEALLAAVAEQGFVSLATAMTDVGERVKARRLQRLGIAYVRFALTHPSHIRIMFGPEIPDKTAHPTLHRAAERAFALLVAAVTDAQRAGHTRPGNPWNLAVAAWALVHGLSTLLVDGQLKERVQTVHEAEVLASRVTKLLETGLGARRS
jgi:AcrR family transcriptional regulator